MANNLTVIIPMYNAEKFIEETIKSIFNQTYKKFNVIILDDYSVDNSYKIVKQITKLDDRFEIIRNEKNLGYLKSTNVLLSLVKTEYCAFWDADDTCDNERFSVQLDFLEKNSDYDLVGSYCMLIDKDSKPIRKVKYPQTVSLNNFNFCGSSVLFRTNVLEVSGLYNPLFDRIGSEDFEWLLRCTTTFKYFCLPKPLYNYRRIASSLTLSKDSNPSFIFSHKIVKSIFTKYESRIKNFYWEDPEIITFFSSENLKFSNEELLNPKGKLRQVLESKIISKDLKGFYKELFLYLKSFFFKADFFEIIKLNIKLLLFKVKIFS
ncbi:glycosyltransferase family 2 protein [Flavobacterium quisquiliarum]|uniref:Glycosyltransferase family 2 protein n=1 Tax=Flavobacterium quisquiliarum TaxID=1834436 RepID=A0ABV8WAL0_9FLAO|nr:glycosyltransferase family 2 protein [Flavobacterium quisquiliarum]MBW1657697.1 glycosyltransferase [Flavobacterium quisquiliarum]